MENSIPKYIHLDAVHNLNAPQLIVPYIIELLNPESVVDVGCGTGTFLKCFQEAGVQHLLGIDGGWVEKDKLHFPVNCFIEANLEKPIAVNGTYDLVLCLEVAEHLSFNASDALIETLTQLGKTIVFSAAVPNQGGQNHLNEQPFSFWQKKFENHGYYFYDIFRPRFWNIKEINWWYKQNMFLVAHHSVYLKKEIAAKKIIGDAQVMIHPELYNYCVQQRSNILSKLEQTSNKLQIIRTGQSPLTFYIKLLMLKLKSFFN